MRSELHLWSVKGGQAQVNSLQLLLNRGIRHFLAGQWLTLANSNLINVTSLLEPADFSKLELVKNF